MKILLFLSSFTLVSAFTLKAQIGKRYPSERKEIKDPVTGVLLTFFREAKGKYIISLIE